MGGGRFGRPGGPRGRAGHRGGEAPIVGVLLRQVRELNLSDAQRQRVRDIFSQQRKQRSSAPRPSLDIAVLGDPGSPQFAGAVQSLKDRAAARIERQSELATQVYDVLTPVQRRQLSTLLAADEVRLQARQQRRQQMRERRQRRRSGPSGGGPSSSGGNSGAPGDSGSSSG